MHISPPPPDGRGFVFVHIPKTGGTSMALALEDRAMAGDVLIGDTPKAKRRARRHREAAAAGRLWKHSTLRDIPGLVTPAFIASAFVFTLVRNPFDRLLSYHAWLGRQTFDHPHVALAAARSFGAFLEEPSVQRSLQAAPYAAYVTDASGRERCDAFVRLEHLATDLAPVERALSTRLVMPHANPSDHPRRRDAYTPALRAVVEDVCAADLHRFGYSFVT